MSATLLWIMCVVIVLGLAAWALLVWLASRRPDPRKKIFERRRGRVQGGSHVGGGRSVAPRRDAPVIPDEDPNDSTLPDNDSTLPDRAGRPGSGSGNPMDL
jgi:hypothetical protein